MGQEGYNGYDVPSSSQDLFWTSLDIAGILDMTMEGPPPTPGLNIYLQTPTKVDVLRFAFPSCTEILPTITAVVFSRRKLACTMTVGGIVVKKSCSVTPALESLLSDHSALERILPVQSALVVPRKCLMVPPSRMEGLVVHVVAWCAAVKGSFVDAEALHGGLLHTIEGFIATPRVLARAHAPRRRTYAADPVILNYQQMLAAYQRRWQLNPAGTESRDAMVTTARHLTDLRQQERKKYWVSFLDQVYGTQSGRCSTMSIASGASPGDRCVTLILQAGPKNSSCSGRKLILLWPSCGTPGGA
ncbi:hypothetical protein E2C01_088945 [Portunus trituberculatus]|uniref:Uncharacterized protein n=1 Tax=Portunus trituberculatus TaxID=210409 RepID=A0A5B7JHF1_PORTR|nr:hypothetical protein [Portunus trituberculatus]